MPRGGKRKGTSKARKKVTKPKPTAKPKLLTGAKKARHPAHPTHKWSLNRTYLDAAVFKGVKNVENRSRKKGKPAAAFTNGRWTLVQRSSAPNRKLEKEMTPAQKAVLDAAIPGGYSMEEWEPRRGKIVGAAFLKGPFETTATTPGLWIASARDPSRKDYHFSIADYIDFGDDAFPSQGAEVVGVLKPRELGKALNIVEARGLTFRAVT